MEIVGFPPDGHAGIAYSYTFTGIGGDGSYTFQFTTDPIIAGWIDSGGTISNASPSADSYTMTVTMHDGSRSPPVTQTYPFTIT
jgi:hypothetical protein